MKHKRNKRRRILQISICCFVLLCAALYWRGYTAVNQKYPAPETETYSIEQPAPYEGAEITVTGSRFMSQKEAEQNFADEFSLGYDLKCIVVELTVTNPGPEEITVDLTPLALTSGAWENGINLVGFMELNTPPAALNAVLQAGDSLRMQLPFTMLSQHFKPDSWKDVENRDFSLEFSLYPVKRSISL